MKQLVRYLKLFILHILICFKMVHSTRGAWCNDSSINEGCRCLKDKIRTEVICTGFESLQKFWAYTSKESYFTSRKQYTNKVAVLKLVCNGFTELGYESFRIFHNLKMLDLSRNQLSYINEGAFQNLPYLTNLDLSHNNLSNFSSNWFESNDRLMILDLAYNKFSQFSSCLLINVSTSLKHLILSNNDLISIDSACFTNLTNLHILDLSNNNLLTIEDAMFLDVLYVRILFLTNTKLTSVPSKIQLAETPQNDPQTFIKAEEPVKVKHALQVRDGSGHLQYCVRWKVFICAENMKHACRKNSHEAYLIQICHNLCKTCACKPLFVQTTTTVNCTKRGLAELPSSIPVNTGEIDLSGNKIKRLDFEGKQMLSHEWGKVTKVNLRSNQLTTLEGLNMMAQREGQLWLDVSHNNLHYIDVDSEGIKRVGTIFLSFNPFRCDCETIRLQSFLGTSPVNDGKQARCSSSEGNLANKRIYSLQKSELCPRGEKSAVTILADIVIFCSVVGILVMVIKLLHDYRYTKKTGKLPYFFQLQLE